MKEQIKKTVQTRLKQVSSSPFRQTYHLMADIGWISDPNGLCLHNGTIHIFHQYTPAKDLKLWKSWGHWTTKDWKTFQDEGCLMTPDSWMDKDGCYSGSGYSKDGILHLFYTGNVLEEGDHDYIYEGRGHYVCHLQSEDGLHFSSKQCLLKNEDYPSSMSCHVRDPKVSDVQNKTILTLGARTKNDEGCALIFAVNPKDPTHLSFLQEIHSKTPFGYMWECPDLFELDGHLLLLACPQGLETKEHQFENIYQNGIFTLDGSLQEGTLKATHFQELDQGFDFYAPQTMVDHLNRRILIGWMGMPDAPYDYPEKKDQWIHCLTLPRELKWKNNRVFQYPIQEVYNLLEDIHPVQLEPGKVQPLKSPVFYLDLNIENNPFVLNLRQDAQIQWDGKTLTLSFQESGAYRTTRHIDTAHIDRLEIFSDQSSLEIFINQGEFALTSRVYDDKKSLILQSDISLSGRIARVQPLQIDYSKVIN